jgi:hypothetical protein
MLRIHKSSKLRSNKLLELVVGGLVVIMLAIGRKVRGFKPRRGRWIFKDDNSPLHAFHRRGSKAVGPM